MTTMTATDSTPRAWVGCLGCYNNGDLVGRWLDDPDEIREYACPTPPSIYVNHEEVWVFDHENAPWLTGECSPGEFADRAEAYARALDSHVPDVALAAYIDNIGADYVDWDTLADDVEEAYIGVYENEADFAYTVAEETGSLPDGPYSNYIDWAAVGRDARLSGEVWFHEAGWNELHAFRSR